MLLGSGDSPPGSRREMEAVLFLDLHRGAQPHHVVDRTLHQAHRAGDGGADNVLARRGVAAVAPGVKAGDAAALRVEGDWWSSQALILVISTLV